MDIQVNPYVSVDCVLLGFDGSQLNVLLVRQRDKDGGVTTGNWKLPGSLIYMNEGLEEAAKRVLKQLTGLVQVKMTQFKAFGDPHRTDDPQDNNWLERVHQLQRHVERIVTIAYLSLLRINRKMKQLEPGYEARWCPISEVPRLAFDHNEIVNEALKAVRRITQQQPERLFDLLPRKFTAAQLRQVMESVSDMHVDVKNFHKKLQQMPYVVPLDEKEEGVSHRAARYYKFKKT